MASDVPESSRAREEAAQREEASRQEQRAWVALSSIPVVYRSDDAVAAALAPGVADFILELEDPPRASYLVLPPRIAPEPRSRKPKRLPYYILVANSDRILVAASQGRSVVDPESRDYLLCDVRTGTATRLPVVPAGFPMKLRPRRSIGLIADPRRRGHHMVAHAQLHPVPHTSLRRHDSLLCYSTATAQWAVKPLASAPDHEPWGAHGVLAHDGQLWWVDIVYGMLFCDPFKDQPRLRFVPLPPGSEMQGLGDGDRPSWLMEQRRCISASEGKLRYVEIQGLSYDLATVNNPSANPAVKMWTLTLVNPSALPEWKMDHEASFAEIWADGSYVAAGLPQGKVPKLGFVDPSNHEVVYFFHDAFLFAFDLRQRQVIACDQSVMDRRLHDLDVQFTRFVDAWVLSRSEDLVSSDRMKGTDEGSSSLPERHGKKIISVTGPNPLLHLRPSVPKPKPAEVALEPANERTKVESSISSVDMKIKHETNITILKKLFRQRKHLKISLDEMPEE